MPKREFPKNSRETIRVAPTRFQGHDLVDIRIFAPDRETRELMPTKKGISLNVDTIPELIDVLTWALGQPCEEDSEGTERRLKVDQADLLADVTWKALQKHGTAVHWDSIEKMVLPKVAACSKWDLHFVLATRRDLFERVSAGCFRARKVGAA